mmetsp:Transcript_15212/g.39538  ORF Transcript_15212/g.39538 Transcript_15212/m.39538 type:complete len:482 (-) Transcript_15212:1872-3317(-)|eukprot:CAMPEP_0119410326 /NCGR_PEP_ID=MMETSP1335-20130426/3379_1 /TAXON_ID=259385 /ORGANISM="Chrysoculter rhomboideus, Strain RCC1486" /LENGTH=481 /DNA_ID=CAMNT_0007434831 /DNA_START=81 /DNA_END=1526 /DNA_ORIENTATION=-
MADIEWEIGLKPNTPVPVRDVASRATAILKHSPPIGSTPRFEFEKDAMLANCVHVARATVRGGAAPWTPTAAATAARKPRVSASPSDTAADGASNVRVFVHALYDDEVTEEYTDGMGASEEDSVAWQQTTLPALALDGHWESLLFESSVKERLLSYARSALAFASASVDTNLVSCHRLLLLHGPPGTGKTSLCRALAHKLTCRTAERFPTGHLIELNAHSLFSKWFSESGKLVGAVFAKVRELVDDRETFVSVLIDEVESLVASRAAALNGTEPSDAVRVVNAVLTQLDSLKNCPNVLVLATSNITQALDAAFSDRADLTLYIGLPDQRARYQILATCIGELGRAGVLAEHAPAAMYDELNVLVPAGGLDLQGIQRLTAGARGSAMDTAASEAEQAAFRLSLMLYMLAQATHGWSGRSLRRLPLLAHAEAGGEGRVAYAQFLLAMHSAVMARDAEGSRLEAERGGARPRTGDSQEAGSRKH